MPGVEHNEIERSYCQEEKRVALGCAGRGKDGPEMRPEGKV